MSLAGKTLKELYPSLMQVTCVAHLLHNCAMRVRAHFKTIDEIIAIHQITNLINRNTKYGDRSQLSVCFLMFI